MKHKFVKMQGLGNDFIVFDDLSATSASLHLDPALVKTICDRRLGIGADQILHLKKPKDASAQSRMEVWNADGSEVEMCGNGIRAVGLYLQKTERGKRRTEYVIETLAGLKTVYLSGSNDVRVNLGQPLLSGRSEDIEVGGRKLKFYDVNLGNPHAVIFLDETPNFTLRMAKLEDTGARLERNNRFPNRTNVEFVEVLSRKEINVTVWERGAGWTLACGTGACAAAVAAIAKRKVDLNVRVNLPGGTLRIEWAGPDHPVWMQGPAFEVYEGELDVSALSSRFGTAG